MADTPVPRDASRPHMPGYDLLPADGGRGLLPWSWALERLARTRNFWLSTARPDGRPHCMAVWGLWREDGFWFSTGRSSRKARNLRAHPACVVATEDGAEPVVIEGSAAEVTDDARLAPFFDAYERKYGFRLSRDEGPIFAVRPQVAFGFIENAEDFPGSATRWRF